MPEYKSMSINQDIKNMADIISQSVPAEKIYLFGSYAYGIPHKNSDYDFFIVVPDGGMRPIEVMQEAHRALSRERRAVPVDILASTKSNFIDMSGMINSIEKEVFQKGVLLFERNYVDQ